MQLTKHTLIQRKTGILAANLENETVLMSVQNGAYFGMNDTGGRIWELVENPTTAVDMAGVLSSEYDIPEDDCCDRVMTYLGLLNEKELIVEVNE